MNIIIEHPFWTELIGVIIIMFFIIRQILKWNKHDHHPHPHNEHKSLY